MGILKKKKQKVLGERSNSSSSSEDFETDDRVKLVDEWDILKYMGENPYSTLRP